jgi:replicative DNA helicase
VLNDEEIAALTQRVPTHSIPAEQAVLGGLLLNNDAWDAVSDLLAPEHFYAGANRLIFATIRSLIEGRHAADSVSVFEALKRAGRVEEAGGLKYVSELATQTPSAANIATYARIVRDRALLRGLLVAADEIVASVFDAKGAASAEAVHERAEARLFALSQSIARGASGWVDMVDLLPELIDQVQKAVESGDRRGLLGVSTGLVDIDQKTRGLQAGDLVVIAGRPSMGKTALAMNIAQHVALQEGRPVGVFSMEMGHSQLAAREVASMAQIDSQRLSAGELSTQEWTRLTDTLERVPPGRLFIEQTGALTPGEIRARSRRLARRCGGALGLIVVDYLQLMSAATQDSRENRATQIAEFSRSLKALAKELNCPVIALSQLNRSLESRTDKRPLMSDLRESGAIEQDADIVIGLYRDEYYNPDSTERGIAEAIILKQRNGPTGIVPLAFRAPFTRFDNLARIS